jgi:WhiB family transcriptional regulator, redox-sensing transcriptional regulator
MTATWADLGKREELSWQDDAICSQTDPEAFFPEKGDATRDAKRVCLGCPVRDLCLKYALDTGQTVGVWGGLSALELRHLRRRHNVADATMPRTAPDTEPAFSED